MTALAKREPPRNRLAARCMGWAFAGDVLMVYGKPARVLRDFFRAEPGTHCAMCEKPWAKHARGTLEKHLERGRGARYLASGRLRAFVGWAEFHGPLVWGGR